MLALFWGSDNVGWNEAGVRTRAGTAAVLSKQV